MIKIIHLSQYDTVDIGIKIEDASGQIDLTGSTISFVFGPQPTIIPCRLGGIVDGEDCPPSLGGVTIPFTEQYLAKDGRFFGYIVRVFSSTSMVVTDEDYFGEYFSDDLADSLSQNNVQITYPDEGFIEVIIKKSVKLTT